MSDLPKRVLSALAAVLIMFFVYQWKSNSGLYVLGCIVILIGAQEYFKLTVARFNPSYFVRISFLSCCLVLLMAQTSSISFILALALCPILITINLWSGRSKLSNTILLQSSALLGFGLFYASLFPKMAISLLVEPNGLIKFLGLLLLVFSSDIFAYFGGISFGKRPFMPNVSPSKTIEGSISGCAGSAIVTFLYFQYMGLTFPTPWVWLILALPIAFVGQTGDLLASLFKREASVKDSGKIMPGHGGVIDRLDAVYLAAPLYYLAFHFDPSLFNFPH